MPLTSSASPEVRSWLYALATTSPFSGWRSIGFSYDRVRGSLALSLSLLDEAGQWFSAGIELMSDAGFDIEAGRCHQGLAEVAERCGDHALAMQHLDAAGDLFARHGAKLYLDQVLAKKEFLKA